MPSHTLMVLTPGHFHAALPFKTAIPGVSHELFVYGFEGAETEQFVQWIESFNRRAESPTAWRLHLCLSENPMEHLLRECPGDVALVAGQNHSKATTIRALAEHGVHVLADKPMSINAAGAREISCALNCAGVHVRDMMTCRFDPRWLLLDALVKAEGVLGGFDRDKPEALTIESLHFLSKEVAGIPLKRPARYFDVDHQGLGIADVATHYVDRAQLLSGQIPEETLSLRAACVWPTCVPFEDFCAVTGCTNWIPELRDRINSAGDALLLQANGELVFDVGALNTRLRVDWKLRANPFEEEGVRVCCRGCDSYLGMERGKRVEVVVLPHSHKAMQVRDALFSWRESARICHARPVVTESLVMPGAWNVALPSAGLPSHEEQFANMLRNYLSGIDAPSSNGDAIRTARRYELLARAVEVVAPQRV